MAHEWMQNMYRDMARFRSDRQAFVQARRTVNRSVYKEDEARGNTYFEGDQVPFDCFFVCEACGFYIADGTGPCPACGRNDWLDMGSERVAEGLRAAEEAKRHLIPRAVNLLFFILSAIIAGVSVATVVALTLNVPSMGKFDWFVLIILGGAVGLGPLLFLLGRRRAAKLYYKWVPSKFPIRWHMPYLAKKNRKEAREVHGPAVGTKTVKAPFSGKECLAYKASVLFDVHGDARPPEWVSAEIKAVDFSIGALPIFGRNVLVETPLEPVSDETLQVSGVDIKRFLRERGLFLTEGEFWFYESRIDFGTEVTAHFYKGSDIVSVTQRQYTPDAGRGDSRK